MRDPDPVPSRRRLARAKLARGRPAALALALLAALATAAAAAEPEPEAPPVRAILELYINTVDKGVASVAFAGKEVLVAADDLAKAGFVSSGGVRVTSGGKEYVRLSSLAPAVGFAYDDQTLALRLTVDPRLLAATEVELQAARAPSEIIYGRAPSAFLNYAVNGVTSSSPSFFLEQGVALGGTFFDNTVTVPTTARPLRGSTSLSIDDRDNLTRTTIGDITASGGTLGGAITLGGIGYSKNFTIDPYFLPFPVQRFAGIVDTPSTADIYVNGQLVRTVSLQPGPFNLNGIPGVSGAGVTRVVIRNAFGQQQELTSSFYQTQSVLRQGLNQFSYNLGFVRNQGAVAPLGSYLLPALAATHNYGLTDNLTLGGFLQAGPRLAAAGPQATIVVPAGQFSAAVAPSIAGGQSGWSSFVGYDYQTALINLGVTGTYTSARYANLSLTPQDDRPRWQGNGFFAMTLGDWNGLLEVSPSIYRDAGRNDQGSLTVTRRITDQLSVSATAGQSRMARKPVDTSVFIGITWSLGPSTVAAASVSHSREGYASSAQVSRSLPVGPGYGYLAQVQTGPSASDAANLQYQTTFGTYEADVNRFANQTTVRYSASGALAAIGGDIKPTVALRDAYALIRVPGAKGVTGYLSNQEEGRTDADGDLLVPNLLSYYGNRIEINEQDIPMDYRVEGTELVVAPPYRSGAVVEFPVHRFQAIVGKLVVQTETAPEIPAFGELTVEIAGKTYTSPVGSHGEFYFESLPPGTYPANVRYAASQCQFQLTVPQSQERTVKLGDLSCNAR